MLVSYRLPSRFACFWLSPGAVAQIIVSRKLFVAPKIMQALLVTSNLGESLSWDEDKRDFPPNLTIISGKPEWSGIM